MLSFGGACTPSQAQGWIVALNEISPTQLIYEDGLISLLFIALVEEALSGLSKANRTHLQTLLKAG